MIRAFFIFRDQLARHIWWSRWNDLFEANVYQQCGKLLGIQFGNEMIIRRESSAFERPDWWQFQFTEHFSLRAATVWHDLLPLALILKLPLKTQFDCQWSLRRISQINIFIYNLSVLQPMHFSVNACQVFDFVIDNPANNWLIALFARDWQISLSNYWIIQQSTRHHPAHTLFHP